MVDGSELNKVILDIQDESGIETRYDYSCKFNRNETGLSINSQLTDTINEIIEINKNLIYAEKGITSQYTNLDKLNKKIINISNTKPYRMAYVIHRFKFEFLKGSTNNKKNFLKWILNKILRKKTITKESFNPLLKLVKPINKKNLTQIQLSLETLEFLRFKNILNIYYGFFLSDIECPFEKDLVSIVLPVYNGEKMLKESIESIISQKYKNFELIIINDGSSDKTQEIAESYSNDPRIKIFNQQNKGLPKSLSRGFRKASGEYYTWTSDDNIMDPDYIECLVDEMKKNEDVSLIYSNIRLIDDIGDPILDHEWYSTPGTSNVNLPESSSKLNIHANNTIGPSFMYRATAAHIIEDYCELKFGIEDYDYWMRLNALLYIKHSSFHHPIYSYRFHENSLTSKSESLGIIPMRDRLMVWDQFRRDYYLYPMIWILKSDERILKNILKEQILDSGHLLIENEDIEEFNIPLSVPSAYINICSNMKNFEQHVNIDEKFFKVFIMPNLENISKNNLDLNYDTYISLNNENNLKLPVINDFAGWFIINRVDSVFGFLNSKIKNRKLHYLEEKINLIPTKKVSIIVTSPRINEESISSIINQEFSRDDYEILILNDSLKNDNLSEFLQENSSQYFIQELFVPSKNLEYRRNIGILESNGEILIFTDGKTIFNEKFLEKIWQDFCKKPENIEKKFKILMNTYDPVKKNNKKTEDSVYDSYEENYVVTKKELISSGFFRLKLDELIFES